MAEDVTTFEGRKLLPSSGGFALALTDAQLEHVLREQRARITAIEKSELRDTIVFVIFGTIGLAIYAYVGLRLSR